LTPKPLSTHLERELASRDMPIDRKHLPNNSVGPCAEAADLREQNIRGRRRFQLQFSRTAVRFGQGEASALNINSRVESALSRDIRSCDGSIGGRRALDDNRMKKAKRFGQDTRRMYHCNDRKRPDEQPYGDHL